MTNKEKHDKLIGEWELRYKDELKNQKKITLDGPKYWEKWEISKPKILFLAKESYDSIHPRDIPNPIIDNFNIFQNIARWGYAINELYINLEKKPIYPPFELIADTSISFNGICIVNVKKLEGISSSNDSEIRKFAKADMDLLRKQIDLINPNIIVCCKTQPCYDEIYPDFKRSLISPRIETRC